jgi:hypothetical protein
LKIKKNSIANFSSSFFRFKEMSLLKIYLPIELLNECKNNNRDYKVEFENLKSCSEKNIFQIIIKNYQENGCSKVYSSLLIKNECFQIRIKINRDKIEIENINNENIFEKYLILIYEKNQYGLIHGKNIDEAASTNDMLIEEKIKAKVKQ